MAWVVGKVVGRDVAPGWLVGRLVAPSDAIDNASAIPQNGSLRTISSPPGIRNGRLFV
jgi:hypothetical protein